MKPRKEIPLAVQVENLVLVNQTLKSYIKQLEEKLAKYEKTLLHCPRFREFKMSEPQRPSIQWTEPYCEEPIDDDWDDDFDDEDFDEDDFEDEDFDDDDFDDDFDDEEDFDDDFDK